MPRGAERAGLGGAILLAGLLIALFYGVGAVFLDGYLLDLGSTGLPTPRHLSFLALYGAFGAAAAATLGLGLAAATAGERASAFAARWGGGSDGTWILGGALAGFAIPLAIRTALLGGAPLTDDEAAYRFAAELLASGRLWVESPPLKLFFDQSFLINDGRLYAAYFLGWPALMVPGVWLGVPGVMNALYLALTVPAAFLVLRRLAGSAWARAGIVLLLSSPFLLVSAATLLSHTSCFLALAWMTWFFLRSRDEAAPWWSHAGLAFCFAAAFFIRPSSALGVGLPFLAAWVLDRHRRPGWARPLLAFTVPAAAMAALFFAVNQLQNGSPWVTGYQRAQEYMQANDFRFATFTPADIKEYPGFDFGSFATAFATSGAGLFRLNFALFGWPLSVLFLWPAAGEERARIFWAAAASFVLVHLFQRDPGIDSFGPTHYAEMGWPILALTVLGLRRATALLGGGSGAQEGEGGARRAALLPPCLLAALILTAWIGYAPVRFTALGRIAENINLPREAVAAADLHGAVVFAPWPFAPPCRSWPTRHFVFMRPANDPDLEDEVLWVNHVSVEEDRRLMEHFPDRQGYVLRWTPDCRVALLPLAELAPGEVPDQQLRASP